MERRLRSMGGHLLGEASGPFAPGATRDTIDATAAYGFLGVDPPA